MIEIRSTYNHLHRIDESQKRFIFPIQVSGTGLAVRVIPMCIILHVCNILHVIIFPAVVMNQKYDQIGPGRNNPV